MKFAKEHHPDKGGDIEKVILIFCFLNNIFIN